MTIQIEDDFDLWKIANCGQAFRVKKFENGFYRLVTNTQVLYIGKSKDNEKLYDIEAYDFSDTNAENRINPLPESESTVAWNTIWSEYFDLDRNYEKIRNSVPAKDTFLKASCECGKGLRILKQDPWEMLLTFITSQRKSIPAIKSSIERICEKYGKKVTTNFEDLYLFPTAKEMEKASSDELKDCGLGYRVDYFLDAIKQINENKLNLNEISRLSYEDLFQELKRIKGVGDKVSNCICLFAYAKTSAAPVDTWIAKVIDKFYDGNNPFPKYGEVAGIMQQYIFYYALMHKDEFSNMA